MRQCLPGRRNRRRNRKPRENRPEPTTRCRHVFLRKGETGESEVFPAWQRLRAANPGWKLVRSRDCWKLKILVHRTDSQSGGTVPATVESFEELGDRAGRLHLAIGVFDGVHLGHRAVIESAIFSARRSGGTSGVLTFHPHPSRLFRPEEPTCLLMGIESKTAMLHDMGADVVIRKEFNREFAAIEAEDFLPFLKDALPGLAAVYVGENFRFGKKRAGTVETLVASGEKLGVAVFSVERIKRNGRRISSTRIRGELEAGNIAAANDLLGYNYFARGWVVPGAQLGRTIGSPTLNVPWAPECRPRFGVYRVRFRGSPGAAWEDGVANYGLKPTVSSGENAPTLEVHGLGGTSLDAGDWVEVEWLEFLRPEQKFDSVEDLRKQIERDCEQARQKSGHG